MRESLVDAAERAIARRGVEAVTLRAVAKEAGVTHAAPYHHFKNKDALLAAVAVRGFDALALRMHKARGRTPKLRLLAMCDAYVAFATEHPARFTVMFGAVLKQKRRFPELKRAAESAFFVLLQASERVDRLAGLELALAGWCLAHGYSHLAIEGVFETLPVPLNPKVKLARRLAERML